MSSDLIVPMSVENDDDIEALISEAEQAIPTGDDRCIVCDTPLVYGGRGRHPKYCQEHKPSASKSARTTSTPTRSADRMRDEFLSQWNMLSLTVGLAINPVDGQILMGGGPRLADSVIHLAEVNPKFKRAMNKAMEATVWGELIAAMTPMAIMIAANHNMIKIPPMMVQSMATGLGLKVEESPDVVSANPTSV